MIHRDGIPSPRYRCFGEQARRIQFRPRQSGKTKELIQSISDQCQRLDERNHQLSEALEWILSASESVAVVGGSATDLKMARQYARDVLQNNKGEVRGDG